VTDRPKNRGGRREPPGGAPPKGNVKFYCYVQPWVVEEVDRARGEMTRGDFLTLLLEKLLARSAAIDSQIDSNARPSTNDEAPAP